MLNLYEAGMHGGVKEKGSQLGDVRVMQSIYSSRETVEVCRELDSAERKANSRYTLQKNTGLREKMM